MGILNTYSSCIIQNGIKIIPVKNAYCVLECKLIKSPKIVYPLFLQMRRLKHREGKYLVQIVWLLNRI